MAAGTIKLIVDHLKIDSDQSDIPIAFNLTTSCGTGSYDATALFTELSSSANRKKIKVLKSDHTTEIYAEIEPGYDFSAKKMVLHVLAPSVSSSVDEVFYLEYDSTFADNTTYIGDTGDAAAEAVWDSDFSAVWHMAQDPSGGSGAIKDSTANNNDGTPGGSMTSGDLIDADVGKAIDFDGSDDYIDYGTGVALSADAIDIEININFDSVGGSQQVLVEKRASSSTSPMPFLIYNRNTGTLAYNDVNLGLKESSNFLTTGSWMYLNVVRTPTKVRMLQDVTEKYTSSFSTVAIDYTSAVNTYVAEDKQSSSLNLDGKVSELRISTIERSDAWKKATSYSLKDDLVALSSITKVETPVITPTSGAYPANQSISMSCATSGADIYYTEDGSIPDSGDNLYSAPFTLGSAKTIKAIGIKAGLTDSDVATEVYTITVIANQPIITIMT